MKTNRTSRGTAFAAAPLIKLPVLRGADSNLTAAHTSPHRLSAVSGEKMNQFADFENRKSQIADFKSPDGSMARSPSSWLGKVCWLPALRIWYKTLFA
jgi:hypothetical protein